MTQIEGTGIYAVTHAHSFIVGWPVVVEVWTYCFIKWAPRAVIYESAQERKCRVLIKHFLTDWALCSGAYVRYVLNEEDTEIVLCDQELSIKSVSSHCKPF